MKTTITKDTAEFWEINGQYRVYKDDGQICEVEKPQRIPQEIYDERDRLIFNNK